MRVRRSVAAGSGTSVGVAWVIAAALATAALATGEPAPAVAVPEPGDLALRYYRTGNLLWIARRAVEIALWLGIAGLGISARLRALASRIAGAHARLRWPVFLVLLAALVFALELPLDFYAGFVRPHAYGLSNQTLSKWATDHATAAAVALAGALLFLWVPYALARRTRRWWLYTGLLALPFQLFVVFVQPIWIAPLFNDFGPMQDRGLEARILSLAERAGIEGARVFEVDKSVDTRTLNAYVTGVLGTHRIVLWDTLLAKLEPDEVLFVMGHEMGHYVLRHVAKGVAAATLLALALLFCVDRAARALLPRLGPRAGLDGITDPATLPLLLGLLAAFSLVATPVGLAFSRHLEHEADRFGLEITRGSRPAATAFVKLMQENLGNPWPGPWFRLFRASHPPLGERVEFANGYRPWETGAPLRYGDRFRGDDPPATE
jgi:Zn-dependent protease with chaperone function